MAFFLRFQWSASGENILTFERKKTTTKILLKSYKFDVVCGKIVQEVKWKDDRDEEEIEKWKGFYSLVEKFSVRELWKYLVCIVYWFMQFVAFFSFHLTFPTELMIPYSWYCFRSPDSRSKRELVVGVTFRWIFKYFFRYNKTMLILVNLSFQRKNVCFISFLPQFEAISYETCQIKGKCQIFKAVCLFNRCNSCEFNSTALFIWVVKLKEYFELRFCIFNFVSTGYALLSVKYSHWILNDTQKRLIFCTLCQSPVCIIKKYYAAFTGVWSICSEKLSFYLRLFVSIHESWRTKCLSPSVNWCQM